MCSMMNLPSAGSPDEVPTLGVGIPRADVGTARSSEDDRDNITLSERRGRTRATWVRKARAGMIPLEV